MSLLNLKLLRDLRAAVWQFLAITFVAALGVAMFLGSLVSYLNQQDSYKASYERLGFADVTIGIKSAPRSVVPMLARLPGVRTAEGRVVKEVEVEQEAGRRPRVVGRLITLPSGAAPVINRTRLLAGHGLGTASRREVLLEAGFARANHYQPGDRLYPKFQGRRVRFVVAGIVSSPEYIYPVFGKQFAFPMPELFGAMFVREDQAAPLLGLSGSINEVALHTDPGRAQAAGEMVKRRLHPYGPETPTLQADQPSNKLLRSDLEGNKPFLIIMPMLFLSAAALAVTLVLARWVQAQRGQIGFLRASGFPARTILLHYLEVGLVIGICGGILGIGLGYLMNAWYNAAYERVLHTPYVIHQAHPEVAVAAFVLSVFACVLGAYGPARQAARCTPAEALRGQMPTQPFHIHGLNMPLTLTLPLRNLVRRPLRTLGTASGVASAVVLMVIAGAFHDSMAAALASYFENNHADITVAFVPERSQQALARFYHWPGVLRAEPTLELAVRASHVGVEKEIVAIGMLPYSRLRTLPGTGVASLSPLAGTFLCADALADRLNAEEGDRLHFAYFQNTRERHADVDLHMGPVVHQLVGSPAYLRMDEMQRHVAAPLGMPPDAITGALLAVDPAYIASVRQRLNRTDGVAMVLTREETRRQVQDLTAFAQTFIQIIYLLGAAMAFAVIYTSVDIVLWERTRELATLRTVGFSMRRLAALVTLENLLMAAGGAVLGIPPGIWIANYLLQASKNEGFSMQIVIEPQTYLLALGGTLAVVFIAQWPGLRRIRRIDLAAAIRLRDE